MLKAGDATYFKIRSAWRKLSDSKRKHLIGEYSKILTANCIPVTNTETTLLCDAANCAGLFGISGVKNYEYMTYDDFKKILSCNV